MNQRQPHAQRPTWLPSPAREERVKKSKSGWISVVRPSRWPLRSLLRMRDFLNVISSLPHPEGRPQGASRRTHDGDAAFVNSFIRSEKGVQRAAAQDLGP